MIDSILGKQILYNIRLHSGTDNSIHAWFHYHKVRPCKRTQIISITTSKPRYASRYEILVCTRNDVYIYLYHDFRKHLATRSIEEKTNSKMCFSMHNDVYIGSKNSTHLGKTR